MTKEEYRESVYDVIYLVSCIINGHTPDSERAAAMNKKRLYHAAKAHEVRAMTAMALESAGIKDSTFTEALGKAMRRTVLFDTERAKVLRGLEKRGIWYLVLKGAVLKRFYPKTGMREMSDNDILFDAERAAEVREMMQGLGYECDSYGKGWDDVYYKQPVLNFEMHRKLFGEDRDPVLNGYYKNVKERLVKDEGNGYGYHFTPEDFYVYVTAHEYKHYMYGGTGIRSLLDSYVFLKNVKVDMGYVRTETDKLGITEYAESSRSLAEKLFGGGTLDAAEKKELDYYIFSGVYGNIENKVANKVSAGGGGTKGKLRYIRDRIFMPMGAVKARYPFFYRHKLLLPVLFIYRAVAGLTVSRKKVVKEIGLLFEDKRKQAK